VHPQHAEELRVLRRERAKAHQGQRAGSRHPHELGQKLARRRAGVHHAAAGVDDRLLGREQHVHRRLDLLAPGFTCGR
jgi:hypothetical protein